ncbi:MAG: Dps family protein [Holosporaceae bacterium]
MSSPNTNDVCQGLARVLSDTYVLYLKTQNYHWNVKGQLFHSLHALFEEQYTELSEAVDQIAERIRMLGHNAPGSFKAFASLASLKEAEGDEEAMTMVKTLAADQKKIEAVIQESFKLAADAGDDVTLDLLTGRLAAHQKNHWMLSALAA